MTVFLLMLTVVILLDFLFVVNDKETGEFSVKFWCIFSLKIELFLKGDIAYFMSDFCRWNKFFYLFFI